MEKRSQLHRTVTFDDRKEYINNNSNSGEDVQSDDDVLRTERADNLSKTSSAVGMGCEGGDMHSASSVSTSILDDSEEVKILKKKILELETKNKLLDFEIEKANLYLINERTKNAKLEKKLQFVKDNQDVFIKLKEAYINMKYNEAAGRKMVEIREKGLQTWEGILCKGCIDAEQLRRQLESVQQTYKDSYIISPFQLEQLMSTVRYLKDLIERRELTWFEIAQGDQKMKTQINRLEYENGALRELLQGREHAHKIEGGEYDVADQDLATYKKIIIKYEKKMREIEKTSAGFIKCNMPFNGKEKKILQFLMTKYWSHLNDKPQDKQSTRSLSRVPQIVREPSSKCSKGRLDNSHPDQCLQQKKRILSLNNHCRANRSEDNTLKVMNYILDTTEVCNGSDNS